MFCAFLATCWDLHCRWIHQWARRAWDIGTAKGRGSQRIRSNLAEAIVEVASMDGCDSANDQCISEKGEKESLDGTHDV